MGAPWQFIQALSVVTEKQRHFQSHLFTMEIPLCPQCFSRSKLQTDLIMSWERKEQSPLFLVFFKAINPWQTFHHVPSAKKWVTFFLRPLLTRTMDEDAQFWGQNREATTMTMAMCNIFSVYRDCCAKTPTVHFSWIFWKFLVSFSV